MKTNGNTRYVQLGDTGRYQFQRQLDNGQWIDADEPGQIRTTEYNWSARGMESMRPR